MAPLAPARRAPRSGGLCGRRRGRPLQRPRSAARRARPAGNISAALGDPRCAPDGRCRAACEGGPQLRLHGAVSAGPVGGAINRARGARARARRWAVGGAEGRGISHALFAGAPDCGPGPQPLRPPRGATSTAHLESDRYCACDRHPLTAAIATLRNRGGSAEAAPEAPPRRRRAPAPVGSHAHCAAERRATLRARRGAPPAGHGPAGGDLCSARNASARLRAASPLRGDIDNPGRRAQLIGPPRLEATNAQAAYEGALAGRWPRRDRGRNCASDPVTARAFGRAGASSQAHPRGARAANASRRPFARNPRGQNGLVDRPRTTRENKTVSSTVFLNLVFDAFQKTLKKHLKNIQKTFNKNTPA